MSNYNRDQIEQLESATGVLPAVNQMEYHPWVPIETRKLFRWCRSRGIAVTVYGSLGGSQNKARGNVISMIAERHKVSNAQVLLRWALDQGAAVIPGATSQAHIRENLFIPDFHLDEADLRI